MAQGLHKTGTFCIMDDSANQEVFKSGGFVRIKGQLYQTMCNLLFINTRLLVLALFIVSMDFITQNV